MLDTCTAAAFSSCFLVFCCFFFLLQTPTGFPAELYVPDREFKLNIAGFSRLSFVDPQTHAESLQPIFQGTLTTNGAKAPGMFTGCSWNPQRAGAQQC